MPFQTRRRYDPSRVVISDSNGRGVNSAITTTELNRLDGVTSSVQTQLNNKLSKPSMSGNRVIVSNSSGSSVDDSAITTTELGTLNNMTDNILERFQEEDHYKFQHLKTVRTNSGSVDGKIYLTKLGIPTTFRFNYDGNTSGLWIRYEQGTTSAYNVHAYSIETKSDSELVGPASPDHEVVAEYINATNESVVTGGYIRNYSSLRTYLTIVRQTNSTNEPIFYMCELYACRQGSGHTALFGRRL